MLKINLGRIINEYNRRKNRHSTNINRPEWWAKIRGGYLVKTGFKSFTDWNYVAVHCSMGENIYEQSLWARVNCFISMWLIKVGILRIKWVPEYNMVNTFNQNTYFSTNQRVKAAISVQFLQFPSILDHNLQHHV